MNKEIKTSRIRQDEMEAAIYRPKEDIIKDQITITNITTHDYYTIVGKEDFKDNQDYPRLNHPDNEKICAKTFFNGGRTYYFIRIGDRGRLYNPIGLYDEQRYTKDRHLDRGEFAFSKVSPKVFQFYINFLKTKNQAYLSNAEREMI